MDIEPEIILEEGEITDDDIVGYTPLERPATIINNTALRNVGKQSDNDSDWSSESDSDSDDFAVRAKKTKLKIKTKTVPLVARATPKRKKYDIWSKHVQEDVLAETLISCDVSRIDRSRDVETYNYPERHHDDKFDLRNKIKTKPQGTKRKHNRGRQNSDVHLRRREDTDDEDDVKGSVRVILDLIVTPESPDDEVARDLANKLSEEKDDLMLKIVQIAGKKKAIEIFNETKRIEEDGGMLIMNRTRRRTPGGVFIFLLKRDEDITTDQQKQIFSEEKREQVRERKAKQKAKFKAIRAEIALKKSTNGKLPELLTRAELTAQKLNDSAQEQKDSESEEFVNNPPPSPVTDGKENSTDGMNDQDESSAPAMLSDRVINSYVEDFLDIGTTADMDMF